MSNPQNMLRHQKNSLRVDQHKNPRHHQAEEVGRLRFMYCKNDYGFCRLNSVNLLPSVYPRADEGEELTLAIAHDSGFELTEAE